MSKREKCVYCGKVIVTRSKEHITGRTDIRICRSFFNQICILSAIFFNNGFVQ